MRLKVNRLEVHLALKTKVPGLRIVSARSMIQMMIFATILGAVFTTSGLIVSYQPSLPAGATIILIAGTAYLLATAIKGLVLRFHGRRD